MLAGGVPSFRHARDGRCANRVIVTSGVERRGQVRQLSGNSLPTQPPIAALRVQRLKQRGDVVVSPSAASLMLSRFRRERH